MRLISRRSLIKHLGVSGGLLAASCGSRFGAFAQNPDPRTFGIDVSVWGGKIDWHRVAETLNPRTTPISLCIGPKAKTDPRSYSSNQKRPVRSKRTGLSQDRLPSVQTSGRKPPCVCTVVAPAILTRSGALLSSSEPTSDICPPQTDVFE